MSITSWDTPRTPRAPMTPFDMKFYELDDIKKDLKGHASKISNLTLDYQDWFGQQIRSFLSTIKHLQAVVPSPAGGGISTMAQFRKLVETFDAMKRTGKTLGLSDQHLKAFMGFWDRLVVIKSDVDEEVTLRLNMYVDSVTRLRQQQIKQKVDDLVAELNSKFSEDFNFSDLRDTGKVYTFRLTASEDNFQGLVTFIPHLLKLAAQVCYFSSKIHLEKE